MCDHPVIWPHCHAFDMPAAVQHLQRAGRDPAVAVHCLTDLHRLGDTRCVSDEDPAGEETAPLEDGERLTHLAGELEIPEEQHIVGEVADINGRHHIGAKQSVLGHNHNSNHAALIEIGQ